MRTVVAISLACAVIAGVFLPRMDAKAHHGWGSYDAAKPFTISAAVEHIEWQNPHVHMVVRHDGVDWEATLAPISRMQTRGLSAEMLKPGTRVAVQGYPSTARPNELRAERITVDGKTFELR